ncbi:CGNR zinc finger domain-containing protein [Micromonospora chersina]|uniref:CGNR zinc finger domain-containing protein n=1 Tax=Micromonospora chersina TaxID=47854 RepID=UPI00371FFCAC
MCAPPTCHAAFFDTSQSRTRRWCDMNTCGNRQRKARFKANQRQTSDQRSDLRTVGEQVRGGAPLTR